MAKIYRLRQLKTAEPDFVEDFIQGLRADDRRELLAISGDVKKEIEESINFSAECWTAMTEQNEPIVLFGRTMLPERDGALIWCLGTEQLKDYWFPFLRQSRGILQHWAKEYGFLYNAVADFNTASMRWLAWLGARFGEEIPVNGEKFIRFTIESEDM